MNLSSVGKSDLVEIAKRCWARYFSLFMIRKWWFAYLGSRHILAAWPVEGERKLDKLENTND